MSFIRFAFKWNIKRFICMVVDSKRGAVQNHKNRINKVYYTGSKVLRAYVLDLCKECNINPLTVGRVIGYSNPYQFRQFIEGLNDNFGNNTKVWAILVKLSIKFSYPFNLVNYMHLIETKFMLDEADFLSDSEELINYNKKNIKGNQK